LWTVDAVWSAGSFAINAHEPVTYALMKLSLARIKGALCFLLQVSPTMVFYERRRAGYASAAGLMKTA